MVNFEAPTSEEAPIENGTDFIGVLYAGYRVEKDGLASHVNLIIKKN